MTDPIADFLARIRNAILARHAEVVAPSSKLKVRIADLLKEEGFISGYDVRETSSFPELVLRLRWANPRTNAITGLRRRSRPGQRMYVRHGSIPKIRSGLGIAILSTSKGLLKDQDCRRTKAGGELLCNVW